MDGSGQLFERFISIAPPGFRPVAVRLPQLANYEDLELALREQLPAGEFSIVAESFSGPLAIRLATRAPECVNALVFSNSFADAPRSALYRIVPWALALRFPPPRWIIRRYLLGRFMDQESLEAVRRAAASVSPSLMAKRVVATLRANDVPLLQQLQIPMLYLRGTEDRLVLERSVGVMQRANPMIIRRDIAAPHLLLQTAAAEAWSHIGPFIISATQKRGTR